MKPPQNTDTQRATVAHQRIRRLPRKESACGFKTKLGRNYVNEAEKMSKKWGKRYLVYRCPYCGDAHMTTKICKRGEYSTEVLHITTKITLALKIRITHSTQIK